MDDTPYIHDGADASLRKTVSLLNKIEAKTGSATITGAVTVNNEVEIKNTENNPIPVSDNGGSLTVDGTVTANVSGTVPVSGTFWQTTQPISGTVDTGLTQPLTDAQLRLTAVPVSGTFFQGTQPVSLASVPSHDVTGSGSFTAAQATAANLNATVVGSGSFTAAQATASSLKAQAQILNSAGSLVTYAETGTYGSPSIDVISVQNPQGVAATITTFTSTTASTSLIAAGSTRKAFTVYNSGAGDLYISPTAVCSTTNFQIKLSSGDYWECPPSQVLLSHTGVFASAGTAYVTAIT